jgi:hypothetical protein
LFLFASFFPVGRYRQSLFPQTTGFANFFFCYALDFEIMKFSYIAILAIELTAVLAVPLHVNTNANGRRRGRNGQGRDRVGGGDGGDAATSTISAETPAGTSILGPIIESPGNSTGNGTVIGGGGGGENEAVDGGEDTPEAVEGGGEGEEEVGNDIDGTFDTAVELGGGDVKTDVLFPASVGS